MPSAAPPPITPDPWIPEEHCGDVSDSIWPWPWIEQPPSHQRECSSLCLVSNAWMAWQCVQHQLSKHTPSRVGVSQSFGTVEKNGHTLQRNKSVCPYFCTSQPIPQQGQEWMFCTASHFPWECHSLEFAISIDLVTHRCEHGTSISHMKK